MPEIADLAEATRADTVVDMDKFIDRSLKQHRLTSRSIQRISE